MRKSFLITVGAVIGLGLLASCAMQQAPLSPSTDLIGPSNSQTKAMPILDTFTVPTGLSAPVKFTFKIGSATAEMDASTINTGTIQVFYKTSDTAEAQFTNVSVSYNATLRQGTITPTSGWTDNTEYRVLFTTGIKSAAGAALDGNGNGIAEGATFDNVNRRFAVGVTIGISNYETSALGVSSANVDYETGSTTINSGNASNIPVTYGYVTITVTFDDDIDVARLVSGNALVATGGRVTNATTGANMTPVSVQMTSNAILEAVYDFAANTTYKLELLGGINGIRSSVEASAPLLKGRLFGGDDSSTVAEADDRSVRYISTALSSGLSAAIPSVSSATYSGGTNRYWTVNFNEDMDATTMVAANFSLKAVYTSPNPDEIYSVGIKAVEIINPQRVKIYVPDSFYPNGPDVTMYLYVSRHVKSTDGIKLDTSGDGIGGMEDDDYESSGQGVDSQP